MAAEDDVVVEAPYCVVCRRSSAGKWRKHVFSHSHQHAAQQFFLHQVTRLQAVLNATNASEWRRCVFCDVALGTADAPAHFGGDAHRKQVEAFCRRHRCDADRQMRPQLCLNAAQRRELEVALAAREADGEEKEKQQGEAETVDQAASQRVDAFLSSAASRLEAVESNRRRAVEETPADEVPTRKQQEALLGPLGTGASRCKTLTSSEGVLQNPLGRHEGKRVWGGGMVTLRKREWIPWAIDQLVKEEQADHPEFQQTGADYAPFAHRVTELAKGEGLSSISSVTWGASVGNVHTAAVPPWMVQTKEEYKQCNRREQEAPSPALLTLKNDKVEVKEKNRRDIFSELQAKSECGPDWLPNFGGVWQEGPRSKTKQAFRKATDAAKKPHPKVYNPPKSMPPPPPLPPQPPAPSAAAAPSKPHHEAPNLTSQIQDNKSKLTDPLAAKKQLLLAQKERLRAKMAARRRQ
ncbi:Coiled coil protein 84 [Phytophthora infestans]|uniref:Coiled coil protein 84 n=1 Tax=Phytophthora infestans TaxID=4787 RepID=A0A8S9TU85_PHYIN|nr:Coiled coil protein 84 [Phytophthora infestans]